MIAIGLKIRKLQMPKRHLADVKYFAPYDDFKFKNGRPQDLISVPRVPPCKLIHPNEKPVELLEFLIKKTTSQNATVCDCFMGSGSTGVACINTNRKFIGIELDEKYYKIAEERINSAIKQTA